MSGPRLYRGDRLSRHNLASWQIVTPPSFNPLQEAPTGLWMPNYVSPTWTGTASNGLSGGRDLTSGSPPTAASPPLNGLVGARFNGVGQQLASPLQIGQYVSAGAFYVYCLATISAISGNNGPALAYANPATIASASGFFGMNLTMLGGNKVQFFHWDTAAKTIEMSIPSLGVPVLMQMRFDGTNKWGCVNSTVSSPLACGAIGNVTATTNVGLGGVVFNGTIWELGTFNTAKTMQTFTDVRLYINSKYGLSL